MIKVNLAGDVCLVEPLGPLTRDDFAEIAALVDPAIENDGQLGGLIIKTREFPGWESFGDMVEHMRFVREHHQHINKVALVTDAKVADLFPSIANHFAKAEIKHFAFDDYDDALAWVS